MTKHIFPLLAFVWAAVACTDDSYRGYEENYNDYEMPLSVQVAVGDPYSTRGTGPVDDLRGFEDKQILVWAYNREKGNYQATRTSADTITCLMNEYPAILDGTNSLAKWVNGDILYPRGALNGERFDFYGAFIDNATISKINRSKDAVSLELDIDGSQDIMVSKAPLPVRKNGDVKDYAFSYLSAMDGDDPIFTMHHTLVRVDLEVRPGITKGFSHTVELNKAQLNSRTKARVTTVHKDQSQLGTVFISDAKSYLDLTNADGSALTPVLVTTLEGEPTDPDLLALQARSTQHVGASFFVSPETEYSLLTNIVSTQTADDHVHRDPVETKVRLKDAGASFLQAHRYLVTMTVYGEYAIMMSVSMVPWIDAGGFVIDPESFGELEDLNVYAPDVTLAAGQSTILKPQLLLTAVDGTFEPRDRSDVTYTYILEELDTAIATVNILEDNAGIEITGVAPGETSFIVNAIRGNNEGCGSKMVVVTVE